MMLQPRSVLLDTPVADGGLSATNFFNGQLLSGEDLTAEQTNSRLAQQRLGRAMGSGIVAGLDVAVGPGSTANVPVVTVQPGLGLTVSGNALSLNRAVDLSLQLPADSTSTAVFNPVIGSGATSTPGQGAYLLAIGPDRVQQGAIPVASPGTTPTCTARYSIEAVKFELLQLPLDPFDLLPENRPLLRNIVAHQCFGTDDPQLDALRSDPFGTSPSGYGLLDDLRPDVLTDDLLPLAVLHWDVSTAQGITYLDQWSVRRAIRTPELATPWSPLIGSRRLAESQAMFLQFQDQLQDLRVASADLSGVVASRHFRYLPPVGLLPVDPSTVPPAGPIPSQPPVASDGGPVTGFHLDAFFSDQTVEAPVFIDAAILEPLLRGAQAYAPIDLQSGELIWLYWVRQNRAARPGSPSTASGPVPFIVFTSGHVPYQGDSRFDLGYFGYTNL